MYEELLTRLHREYEEKYGFALFKVDIIPVEGGLRLTGQVLLEAQKNRLEEELRKITQLSIENYIEILADPEGKNELGWGGVEKGIVDVWRKPASIRKGGKELNTQLIPQDEPFRILTERDNWYLIQTIDFTLGWVNKGKVLLDREADSSWERTFRAQRGSTVNLDGDTSRLIEVAERYEGVPYLWGGTTLDGIDCSGLIQRIYKEAYGLILPKHSSPQRKMGLRIPLNDIAVGDIISLTLKERRISHVGLYLGTDRVIHACVRKGRVIIEDFGELLDFYIFAGARRIALFKDRK